MFFIQTSTTFKHAPKTYLSWTLLYSKQPTPDQNWSVLGNDKYMLFWVHGQGTPLQLDGADGIA